MIGRIRGLLIEKKPPFILLDVQGIGYELEAPLTTFYRLPELNTELSLYTHLLVREDGHLLFGFLTDSERRLFRALLKVNGVGARLALTILSGTGADEFASCIHTADIARLTQVPGVGKKTAERLIIEMRDRLADWATLPSTFSADTRAASIPDAVADAISGLIALGYKPQEASRQVHAIDTEGLTSEAIIRAALKALAKSKA
jgi:holliday junction DNA helicase RuvA